MANTSTTNQDQNSCATVDLDCDHMWSMAQQFAYTRLCDKKDNKLYLTGMAASRARRIAATYARFYLETEVGGDPKLKGRYYWMGLAAFASKTVACSLEDPAVAYTGGAVNVFDQLAKGNFWLFMDIAPWHWYWSNNNNSFDKCKTIRSSKTCVTKVKNVLDKLPWSAEALPRIKHFEWNSNVEKGMLKVKQFQSAASIDRPQIQFDHLLAIANHEQDNILQQLIYNNGVFRFWLGVQRAPGLKELLPNLKIVFSNACDTNQSRLESYAPEDTILENLASRMKWIVKVAEKYHGLMQGTTQESDIAYMEQELRTIAGWVAYKDSRDRL